MYAVVSSGGKQYRVEPGSTLTIERLALEPGAAVTFDRVLLVADGDSVMVGTPLVSGASVRGTVLGEERGPKLVIFKFKPKVKYRRRTGHRQRLMRVRIDAIDGAGPKRRPARAKAAAKAESKSNAATKPRTRAPRKATAKPKGEAGAPAKAAPSRARTRPATGAKATGAKATGPKATGPKSADKKTTRRSTKPAEPKE